MELNKVLEFTKNAIRKNLAKAYVWDEPVLLEAFEMIEEYQKRPSNKVNATVACGCWKCKHCCFITRSSHINCDYCNRPR